MVQIHDCQMMIQGIRIAVERIDVGGRMRPPLVFLHEALGCIDMWKGFPARLCQASGLNGIVYDRQGHGRSSPMHEKRPLDYLETEIRDTMPAVLDALGITKAAFFGHSDGGTMALLMAAQHPERVSCCVTEAAHVFVEEETRAGIQKAVKAYEDNDLKRRLEKYHGKKTDALFWAWADIWLSEEFRSWDIEADIREVVCPVLVLQGEEDEYATFEQVERIARNVSGPAEIQLIPECGHIPHIQAMDLIVDISAGFLRSQHSLGLS